MRTKLRQQEKVLFESGKHWIVLSRPVMLFFIAAVLLFFSHTTAQLKNFSGWVAIGLILSISYLIYAILERKFNIWVVTSLRTIEEWGILTHNAKENPLEKINNVAYKQSVLGRILDYGNVEIQTAAESGVTVLPFLNSPKVFCNAVVEAQQRLKEQGTETLHETDMRECPFCAERIKKKAKVCRFCGRDVISEAADTPPVNGSPSEYYRPDPKEYWKSVFLLTVIVAVFFAGLCYAETKVKDRQEKPHYSDSAKEGWWWYDWHKKELQPEEKQEKPEQRKLPSFEELWAMHPAEFQALLNEALQRAVMTLKEEDVKEYLFLQNIASKKSLGFANVAAYVIQKHPELSVEKDVPITTPGRVAFLKQRAHEVENTIKKAAKDFALLYFYSPQCPYCEAQDEILRFFYKKYDWAIKKVNIEENPSLGARFNIVMVPSLLLIYKGSQDYIPVSTGVASFIEIEEKLYRGIKLLKGEITPEDYSIYEFQLPHNKIGIVKRR